MLLDSEENEVDTDTEHIYNLFFKIPNSKKVMFHIVVFYFILNKEFKYGLELC